MQCHVRTVCSTISTRSHREWPPVHLWLVFISQAEERGRARRRPAGLLGDCSREQWERSEVTGWRYDTDAVKNASVSFQATLYSMYGKTLYGDLLIKVLNSANGMLFPARRFWSCHVRIGIKLKAATQVCSPNQHVTYLRTAVWILHKFLSKYQKLRITIQGIMMLNIIYFFDILYVKLLVWMWKSDIHISGISRAKLNYDRRDKKKKKNTTIHALLDSEGVCMCPHVNTSVTSADACATVQHVCVCVCQLVWLVCFKSHRVHVSPAVH